MTIFGIGLTTGSFFVPQGGDPFQVTALVLGVGVTTLSCLIPWLKKFTVSAQGGITAETRSAAEVTTGMSEEGPGTFVREGGRASA